MCAKLLAEVKDQREMSDNQNKRLYVVKLGGNVFEKRFYGKSLESKVRIKLTWIKYGHI